MFDEMKLPQSLKDLVYDGGVVRVTEWAHEAGIECKEAVVTRELLLRAVEWLMPETERGFYRFQHERMVAILRRVAVAQSVRWPTLTVVNQRRGALGKVGEDVVVYRTGLDPCEPETMVIAFRDELVWLNSLLREPEAA